MEIPISKWLNACFDERATDAKSSSLFASLCRDIGRKFSGDVAINFATVMQRKLFSKEWSEDELERLLESVGDSQLATFLQIELEFYKGRRDDPDAAGNKKLAALLRFEDASGSVDAELFGEIAALYARAGDYRLALYYLRRAFELFPDFSFGRGVKRSRIRFTNALRATSISANLTSRLPEAARLRFCVRFC